RGRYCNQRAITLAMRGTGPSRLRKVKMGALPIELHPPRRGQDSNLGRPIFVSAPGMNRCDLRRTLFTAGRQINTATQACPAPVTPPVPAVPYLGSRNFHMVSVPNTATSPADHSSVSGRLDPTSVPPI